MVKRFLKERLGTIIFFVIIVIFVIWGVSKIGQAKANAISFSEDYEPPEATADLMQDGKYVSIAKTDHLELFYNETKGAIQVKDLKSGHVWKSVVDDEVFDVESLNTFWKGNVQSPISITYNDLKKRDTAPRQVYAGSECKSLVTEYIPNGVSVEYGFTTPGIYVTIEYTLEDDQLVVRVPVDKIREEYKFAVTNIEVLPYLGASAGNEDGYLFYPDGSGAITTYEKVNTRPSNVLKASYFSYTNKTVSFMNLWGEDNYERYTASLPVYGIKNGDYALFAMVSDGEENSGVEVYPSGTNRMALNHIGFALYTRNVFDARANSISTGSATNSAGVIQRVDKVLIQEDKEVRYFFLSGDDANYGGMANTYRNYLLKEGLLKQADNSEGEMPLALQLLMGVTKDGMVFDEYISMTSYAQVQEILERLNAAGVNSMELVLQAWQDGYDNDEVWGPAGKLGGKSGLKNLNKYLESNPQARVYLGVDTTFATSKTGGLREDEDVAVNGLGVQIAVSDMDGLNYYLLNPQASFERNSSLLKKLEGYGQLGVSYESTGYYVYPDYNVERANGTFTKAQTADKMREMLSATEATGRGIAVRGSNQYVYGTADYLYNLREGSYGLSISDYSVPFVQMVVSGLIPYTTEGSGNLSYDLQVQKLKWIEYGSLPVFKLTYESALNLRDTDYDSLFSSTYMDWEGIMLDTYHEFRDNLSVVYGQQMTGHDFLTDDLVRVEYANGVKVYVNYGNEPVSADGVSVPAKDYLVVGGGER